MLCHGRLGVISWGSVVVISWEVVLYHGRCGVILMGDGVLFMGGGATLPHEITCIFH